MSNIQRRLKNVEVVSSFKNRNSAFDIFNSVPRISYLTFDYLPGTLYNSNPYLVLCTWYMVHTLFLVLCTLMINSSGMAEARSRAQKLEALAIPKLFFWYPQVLCQIPQDVVYP